MYLMSAKFFQSKIAWGAGRGFPDAAERGFPDVVLENNISKKTRLLSSSVILSERLQKRVVSNVFENGGSGI